MKEEIILTKQEKNWFCYIYNYNIYYDNVKKEYPNMSFDALQLRFKENYKDLKDYCYIIDGYYDGEFGYDNFFYDTQDCLVDTNKKLAKLFIIMLIEYENFLKEEMFHIYEIYEEDKFIDLTLEDISELM